MTPLLARECLLQGQDGVANAIIEEFVVNGWKSDRILKNIAQKEYFPHWASIWISRDAETQKYWVTASYISVGLNVLSCCYRFIDAQATEDVIATAVAGFLREIEGQINQSFAVRLLGSARISTFVEALT